MTAQIDRLNGHGLNSLAGGLLPETALPAPPSQTPGPGFAATISVEEANRNSEAFTPEQVEMLAFRRFNPLATFNAATLTAALDGYLAGYLAPCARLWDRLAKQQKTIRNVKAKREESVALRPRVIERVDDSPLAHDQQAVLEYFYANSTATHALLRNVTGKFSKMVMQMMEARAFGGAAHHLIWNPDSSVKIILPSGKSVPSLTAKFEYVPLEFFESRSGALRFLGMTQGFTGVPLDLTAWLITYEESPLMFAASILAYYDKMAWADMVNLSEKFGTPGLVVHTTAQRGTPEGEAAVKLTRSLGANYRGTQFGAIENKVELVWPSGGITGSELPMHTITEDVKRDLASLWLGADLSTQSRGGQSLGASVQAEAEEERVRLDCAWISETLQAGIDPLVLRWHFGDVPILARCVIDAPKNEDRKVLGELVGQAVSLGAKVPIAPVLKRMNVPQAQNDEECFEAPAAPEQQNSLTETRESARDGKAANAELRAASARALATNDDAAFLAAAEEVRALLASNSNFDPAKHPHDNLGRWAAQINGIAAIQPHAHRVGSHKVFLQPVYEEAERAGLVQSREEFHQRLVEAMRQGHVSMVRHDFVDAGTRSLSTKSELSHGDETFHFVVDEEGGARAGQRTPAMRTREVQLAKINEVLESAASAETEAVVEKYHDVTASEAGKLKSATGLDLEGYSHALDNSSVRHIRNQHGDAAKEALRGQLAVTDEDFRNLPQIVSGWDKAEAVGVTKQGRDTILLTKTIGDTLYLVEEVRTKRKTLVPVTLYKRRATPDVRPEPPPAQTS